MAVPDCAVGEAEEGRVFRKKIRKIRLAAPAPTGTVLARGIEETPSGFACHILTRNKCDTLLATSKPLDGCKVSTLRLA